MSATRSTALAIRFLLELVIYVSIALWATAFDLPRVVQVVIAVVAVVATGAVWGLICSPRRRIDASPATRLAVEFILWLLAAGSVLANGHTVWAIVFVGIVVIDRAALTVTRRVRSPLDAGAPSR